MCDSRKAVEGNEEGEENKKEERVVKGRTLNAKLVKTV